jgi:MFS family permease
MLGFIGSAFFLGWALFSVILPQLANSWGRRPVVILTFLVQTTAIAGTLLNDSLLIHLAIAFVLGLFASGRVAVSFVYLIELLTPDYARLVATFSSVLYVSFFALITAYLKFVSNDYAVITYTGVAFGFLSFFGVWCCLDESPLFLLRDGQYTKAESVIRRMYEINGEDSRSKTRLSLSQDHKTI